MSTLASRALDTRVPSLPAMQPFPYEVVTETFPCNLSPDGTERTTTGVRSREAATRESAACAEGVRQGQAAARKQFEEQLARERSSVAAALAQFTRDRAAYFEKVEAEVVQLALSIARKILHREAQVDPLLLAGIVRVALEKIEGATGVVLRVHPQDMEDWRGYLSIHLDPADLPQFVEDASQAPDTCVLETAMGTTVLGLDGQLKEIEQGLMDLLSARTEIRS